MDIMKELAERIYKFLDMYASVKPDFDPEYDNNNEKYTSPDASMMRYCADILSNENIPTRCWSEWSSGGYKPYSSKEGQEEHNMLVKEIYKYINNENN